MPIDSSIYSNIKPVQIDMPQPMQIAQQAMALSQLGMQQRQMQYQMGAQMATRQAFADNTDGTGQVNKEGALSQLARAGYGQQSMALGQQFAAQDKAQAEAKAAQADAASKMYNITGPAFDYMHDKVSKDQLPTVYPQIIQGLKEQGIDVSAMDHPFDQQAFDQYYGRWQNSKESLANTMTRSQTDEAQAKTAEALANAGAPAPMKIGAEELSKFNEDVNNASSRKTTGSLIDARTRADRILTLLNSGAQPGETQAQRITRLNKYMPQIGTEVGTSLAAIMQGGVPNEDLQKKLSPDTISSNLATLRQKWESAPTAANQGALLDAYGDVASKLRDFSAGQLSQITTRARAAYPYANKYFSKQMDQIGSQIAAPSSGGADAAIARGGKAAQGQGGGVPGVTSATASDKLPTSSVKPGDVRRGYVFNGGDPRDQKNWKKR